MNDTAQGVGVAFLTTLAAGGAFTQKIPSGPNEWWVFGMGMVVGTAVNFMLWRRQAQDRKIVLTDAERDQLRKESGDGK